MLSRVLHDWNDADAVRILTSCRNAVSNHSRLLIVEALLGDEVHDHRAAVRMDLHMLTLTHGRERTAAEFAELLRAARFRFERILTPDDTPGLHILEAVPDA